MDDDKPMWPAPRSGSCRVAFNTGLFAARNTPAARAFLAAWAAMLTDEGRERDGGRGVDDQLALNLLFEEGGIAGAGHGEYCDFSLEQGTVGPLKPPL